MDMAVVVFPLLMITEYPTGCRKIDIFLQPSWRTTYDDITDDFIRFTNWNWPIICHTSCITGRKYSKESAVRSIIHSLNSQRSLGFISVDFCPFVCLFFCDENCEKRINREIYWNTIFSVYIKTTNKDPLWPQLCIPSSCPYIHS